MPWVIQRSAVRPTRSWPRSAGGERGAAAFRGRVAALRWPQRPDLRIDAGIRQGGEISPHYDSLLAKLIAWGPDRESARRRLAGALRDLVVAGVPTNQKYLVDTLETTAPPKNREEEAKKARERNAERYG